MDSIYKWAVENKLEADFSAERFERYLEWANRDKAYAFQLYALNTALSEVLYSPIHMLEVALRNRFHTVLSERYGTDWFEQPALLSENLRTQIEKAKADLSNDKRDHSPGRIVAAVTFGFWTQFLGVEYDTLWQTTTHKIAAKPDGKGVSRKEFAGHLTRIRILRNRIAHHEPIIYWDLCKHHEHIMTLTEWLSSAAATWSRHHSRFDEVFPKAGINIKK